MNKGALTYFDYIKLIKNNYIINKNLNLLQVQPSSLDLTLSNECYEIKASFLCPKSTIRKKLKNNIIKKINLKNSYIFKKNKTYLVKINEKLKLKNNIFGKCNPKSSTGRLDIFCRTIMDNSDEYEKIPKNYKGEIFIEITSRSFNIKFTSGDSLNQMRLINTKHIFLSDDNLLSQHINNNPIILSKSFMPNISSGLKISVNLENRKKISGYMAKKTEKIIIFNKINSHKISDFWETLKVDRGPLIVNPGKFYILKSNEKIRIPSNMAGEMTPYDTGIGDFRAHYAGFFDPGFGDPNGSHAVLEVKTSEVPFILEDGQVIARIKYEKLNKKSKVVYGSSIKSNYQNQGLALSKHFEEVIK